MASTPRNPNQGYDGSMEPTPTTLDTYIDVEHHHAAGTIANAIDDVPYGAALLAMRRLHYEGWRRRHEITGQDRDKAKQLPVGTLIRERTGGYRVSYYFERQNVDGETIREVWFKKLDSSHPGCQSHVLDYPITVLDTP